MWYSSCASDPLAFIYHHITLVVCRLKCTCLFFIQDNGTCISLAQIESGPCFSDENALLKSLNFQTYAIFKKKLQTCTIGLSLSPPPPHPSFLSPSLYSHLSLIPYHHKQRGGVSSLEIEYEDIKVILQLPLTYVKMQISA